MDVTEFPNFTEQSRIPFLGVMFKTTPPFLSREDDAFLQINGVRYIYDSQANVMRIYGASNISARVAKTRKDEIAHEKAGNAYGQNSIHDAVLSGIIDNIDDVLNNNIAADINGYNLQGKAPIHLVFEVPNITDKVAMQILQFLHLRGANMHLITKDGLEETVLTQAAKKEGFLKTYAALLEFGLNPRVESKEGVSAQTCRHTLRR